MPGPVAQSAEQLLLQSLVPQASSAQPAFDELCAGDQLRPAWRAFAQHMPQVAAGDLASDLDQRRAQVHQRITTDSVTHNVFGADATADATRPWSLELLPLIIEAADWSTICAGVQQRCQLLEHMLVDLYGEQQLLKRGLLPPALVLRHPGWLSALMGHTPAGGMHLFVVAFDLARAPDGGWWVAAQHTQSPSGLGYVLHNRMVVSAQFPQAFQAMRVQRIASTYRAQLDTLETQAAKVAGDGPPRVVLLTPGPYSETYFEHAYLARYLGLPLVEGGDLTVREGRLFMKSVAGLEPVHGVFRRLDEEWCDPLELREDSTLGIPGLLQAARGGTVVIANALGSGFLESPALQAYLGPVARHLMGQDLLLPSPPTWWGGDAAAWHTGTEQHPWLHTYPGDDRPIPEGQARAAALQDDPDAWTMQAAPKLPNAPLWGDGTLWRRPAMVRVYGIADGRGGWQMLPGGMTRVAQRDHSSISMQRGGTSLDTWVLSNQPLLDNYSMMPKRLQASDLTHHQRPVSSRTGENLFWLGRYTERAEQLVRLARPLLLERDLDMPAAVQQALSMLALRSGLAPHGTPTLEQSATLFERAVLASLADPKAAQGAASIGFNLAALSRSAQVLRDRLSREQWKLARSVGEGFSAQLVPQIGSVPSMAQAESALDLLSLQLAALTGMQTDRMLRDQGWRLLAVGRLLERLQGVTLRLEVFLKTGALGTLSGVELLAELSGSLITMRSRYQRHEDLLALADLLVLDTANPRAVAGVLRRLRTELGKLPTPSGKGQDLADLLPSQGAGLELEALLPLDDEAMAQRIQALATNLLERSFTLAERLGARYFTLAHEVDQTI